MDKAYKDAFFTGYVECALWSGMDDEGAPLDDNYSEDDIAPEAMEEMRRECDDFCDGHVDLLCKSGLDPEDAGHNFCLTRNRHGAGFWDLGLEDGVGDELTDAAHVYGTQGLMPGGDGKLYSHN